MLLQEYGKEKEPFWAKPFKVLCVGTECADDVAISSKFCDFWHACTTYGDMVGGMGCRHAYQGFSIWKLMSNIGYEFYF